MLRPTTSGATWLGSCNPALQHHLLTRSQPIPTSPAGNSFDTSADVITFMSLTFYAARANAAKSVRRFVTKGATLQDH